MQRLRVRAHRSNGHRFADVLLVMSLAVNVLLARQQNGQNPRGASDELRGMLVAPIKVSAADGTTVTLRWDRRKTILYYFHPECQWCERNLAPVAALQQSTRGTFQFVAVTTARRDPLDRDLPFANYWGMSDDDRRRIHLRGTPQTLVLDEDGRIVQTFAGAYLGETKYRLERFFQVNLPAISASSRARVTRGEIGLVARSRWGTPTPAWGGPAPRVGERH